MKAMSSNEKEVNMKTRIILMGLGFVLLAFCGGCDKPDDVPPRILTESQDYQLPKAETADFGGTGRNTVVEGGV